MSYFYGLLAGKMKEKGFSQKKLGEAIGRNVATISKKMNGKSAFSQAEIKKICDILDIPSQEIPRYFFVR